MKRIAIIMAATAAFFSPGVFADQPGAAPAQEQSAAPAKPGVLLSPAVSAACAKEGGCTLYSHEALRELQGEAYRAGAQAGKRQADSSCRRGESI